jgi:putative ABC transport system substrate-binding protein
MNRRTFLCGLTLGTLHTPLAADAQQAGKIPRVGILSMASSEDGAPYEKALEEAFRDLGYVPSKTLLLEHRFASGQPERLRQFAAELVQLPVDVIISGTNPAIAAAKEATSAIPIVMGLSVNPVRAGFVQSLASPGGNITGVSADAAPETILGKQLALLKETLPRLSRVAVLWNPAVTAYRDYFKSTETAALQLGVTLQSVEILSSGALESACASSSQNRAEAMLIFVDNLTFAHRHRIAELAIQHRLPTSVYVKEFVVAGGLMSYGVNLTASYRRAAYYVDRILKGAKPSGLPVEQPTTFEFVINVKTARTLGLTIPQTLLQRADQVIQ